ncbi:unnamed protein product [Thlaspi arvense]|uniref:B30.2/SPRY domain-containing protein n=1 Tax=Thlaspi arvense TaxID=13288 RepID=A0AAU9SML4_THLAR|nr:unnamed protein product [Thlaspi arvense]
MLAWELNTCGYHGEDGHIYLGKEEGESFGPTYTTGDTVGGGINYDSQEFFFTVNGTLVRTVSKYIKGPLFPTVAVHSQNEEVTVNFGQEKFAFDVKGFETSERNKPQVAIEKLSIPQNMNHRLVKNYLLHFGYEETLHAFNLATSSKVPPIYVAQENGVDVQEESYALHERKILRQIGALEKAVEYGRSELAKFTGLTVFQDIVEDCFALLVYECPQESNVGHFLEVSQREVVADAVNAAVLSTNPNSEDWFYSHLETLLRQVMACCVELRSSNDGQGELFSLNRLLKNNNCKRIKKSGFDRWQWLG